MDLIYYLAIGAQKMIIAYVIIFFIFWLLIYLLKFENSNFLKIFASYFIFLLLAYFTLIAGSFFGYMEEHGVSGAESIFYVLMVIPAIILGLVLYFLFRGTKLWKIIILVVIIFLLAIGQIFLSDYARSYIDNNYRYISGKDQKINYDTKGRKIDFSSIGSGSYSKITKSENITINNKDEADKLIQRAGMIEYLDFSTVDFNKEMAFAIFMGEVQNVLNMAVGEEVYINAVFENDNAIEIYADYYDGTKCPNVKIETMQPYEIIAMPKSSKPINVHIETITDCSYYQYNQNQYDRYDQYE